MKEKLLNWMQPPTFDNDGENRAASIINRLLWLVGVAGISIFLIIPVFEGRTLRLLVSTQIIMFVLSGLGLFALRRKLLGPTSVIFGAIIWLIIAVASFFTGGSSSVAFAGFIIAVQVFALIFGSRAAFFISFISILYGTILFLQPDLVPSYNFRNDGLGNLFANGFYFLTSVGILQIALRLLQRSVEDFRAANTELEAIRSSLETQVANRTRDLELVNAISQRITAIRDPELLLQETVYQIQNAFNLYHVQIYLTNPGRTMLVLRAGTGPASQELLRRGHSVSVGGGSFNGIAAAQGHSVLVEDIIKDASFIPNPLLPETRAELAVPMIREQVVGVVNLQHNETGLLTTEIITLFESLANQIAIAVENTTLYAAAERANKQLERQARRLERQGWQDYLDAVERPETMGYVFDKTETRPLNVPHKLQHGHVVRVPLSIIDEEFGSIQAVFEEGREIPEDDYQLITSVAQQVSRQIENMRLVARSEKFRAEAENAVQRLIRENWEKYLDTLVDMHVPGYVYDRVEVVRYQEISEVDYVEPIQVQGETVGEIMFSGLESKDPDNQLLVKAVVAQLSGHIENLRLTEQTERALIETEEQARRLERLNEMSEAITKTNNIDVVLTIVTNTTRDLLAADRSTTTLLEGRDKLRVFAHDGIKGRVARGALIEMSDNQSIEKAITMQDVVNVQRDIEDMVGGMRVLLIAPMVVGERVIGTINLGRQQEHPFDARDEQLLQQIASITASTIENQRLFDETQQRERMLAERTRDLEASQRITFAATESANPEELLELVVNLIRDQFDIYHAQVFMIDQPRQKAVLQQATGYAGKQLLAARHALPLDARSLVTHAIKDDVVLVVGDVTHSDVYLSNALLPDTRSEMVLPLRLRGQIFGVLDLHSREDDFFSERSEALFTTMAEQVALIFENSDLLKQASEQTEVLTRFTTQLQTAAEITGQVSTILDPDTLINSVVDLLFSRYDLYHCHVYLLDREAGLLRMRSGSGEIGRLLREREHQIPLDREHSLVARAARIGGNVISNVVKAEPYFMANELLPETRSEVAIPLISRGNVLGVLDLQDSRENRFQPAEINTFSALGGQIANALENAFLFDELQETTRRLQEVDQLKSEFLANMSHELRTPLNSIIGYAEIILMGLNGVLDDETLIDVQAIYDNGQHLLRLINDVLDLAKIEAGRMTLTIEDFSIDMLFDQVRTSNYGMIMKLRKELQIVTEVESGFPLITGDRVRLSQVLNNLVSNAIKFSDHGEVYLRARREDDQVCIEVEDNGIGISEADMSLLFESFRQVDGSSTRNAEGTGLGLPISRHLVELHGGTLTVESVVGEGSTFIVLLPTRERIQEVAESMRQTVG